MISDSLAELLIQSIPGLLIPGLTVTIPLTLVSFGLGLILALFTALVQIARVPILRQIARFYVWIIRGTPLLVQLYIIFYGLPSLNIKIDAIPSAIIAFTLSVGAYTSETLRAAILSVPQGQLEAGYCVGMTFSQTMRRIIIPQAFKTAFPPLFNSFIGLTKDTSLAANVTVLEMFMSAQRIAARTYEPFALYCEVGVIYLLFCTVLSKIQDIGERKLEHMQ
ncbi:amino acid ABC transporter permease [Acidaminococcus massiliensis]|jgi:cystine transport system permease protein|uniref:amino acid ABC transporter permease n=2 Tax=Acidaminococcus massiliensis TaxID=1852375 RepID=UPI0022E3B1D3|nr:amino acid ABC transporter permease [Acidaminococcus massiliensis]